MEEDDLENIFVEYEAADNDTEQVNLNEEAQDENAPTRTIIPAPKRVVKNPRLKFNADRLCGNRGIPVLVEHFKNVKFKGKGHEASDLQKLLASLEHWTHRLFPSMKFGDCLRHIEKLGKKRPVQTCLTKIRLGMPILDNEFVNNEDDDNVRRNYDSEPELAAGDAFDQLLETNTEPLLSNSLTPATNNEIPLPNNIMPTSPLEIPKESVGHILGTMSSVLTEEQRQRMEYNKRLAANRRKARLAAANCLSESLNSSKYSPSIIDNTLDSISSDTSSMEINTKQINVPQNEMNSLTDYENISNNTDILLASNERNLNQDSLVYNKSLISEDLENDTSIKCGSDVNSQDIFASKEMTYLSNHNFEDVHNKAASLPINETKLNHDSLLSTKAVMIENVVNDVSLPNSSQFDSEEVITLEEMINLNNQDFEECDATCDD